MCLELIEERRAEPGAKDDLIAILTQAFDDGALAREDRGGAYEVEGEVANQALTDDELIMFLVLIVVAGNETTRNALTGGLVRVLAVPRAEAAGDRRPIPLGDRRR